MQNLLMPTFDKAEERILRELHKEYLNEDCQIDKLNIMMCFELSKEKFTHIFSRFEELKIVGIVPPSPQFITTVKKVNIDDFENTEYIILPKICEIISLLDNRPLPDYWAKSFAKVKSKWWTVPLAVLFFTLPAIVQYVQWGNSAVQWYFQQKSEPAKQIQKQEPPAKPSEPATQEPANPSAKP